MSEDAQPMLKIMAADAEAIATLLRQKRGDRSLRPRARAALATAFSLIETGVEDSEVTVSAAGVGAADVEVILLAAVELETVRRKLGDGAQTATRPLKDVWVRTPLPVMIMPLVYDQQRQRLVAAVCARAELPLALSEARIAWMEKRCNVEHPGVVRQVRAANSPESERLLGSELELIRKRGRSRFS